MGAEWPEWWQWELELTPHVRKRMDDRQFNDTELRTMLADATGLHPDRRAGRFVIETTHDGLSWHVIVEPDTYDRLLVIVTAYPA